MENDNAAAYDATNNIGRIVSIKWRLGGSDFSYHLGQEIRIKRKPIGRISNITRNTAGFRKYGVISYIIYVENTNGIERIWQVVEDCQVNITCDVL